jgi:hypothetical protein
MATEREIRDNMIEYGITLGVSHRRTEYPRVYQDVTIYAPNGSMTMESYSPSPLARNVTHAYIFGELVTYIFSGIDYEDDAKRLVEITQLSADDLEYLFRDER